MATTLCFSQHSYCTNIMILEFIIYPLHSSFKAERFLGKKRNWVHMVILGFLAFTNMGQSYICTLSESNCISSQWESWENNVFLHGKAHYYKATKPYYRELLESRCECTPTFISLSIRLSFSARTDMSNRKYFH